MIKRDTCWICKECGAEIISLQTRGAEEIKCHYCGNILKPGYKLKIYNVKKVHSPLGELVLKTHPKRK